MNLALFDFDGTITTRNSFTKFIHFAIGRRKFITGMILMAPVILGYKLRILSAKKTREIIAGFSFKGRNISDIHSSGLEYATRIIPKFIRSKALNRIKWHKEKGDHIVVVSASLDVYLKHWCEINKLDLICSKFETKNGLITGKYNPGDCSGEEKARRIKEKYDINNYDLIYAYGDTFEDHEMLNLADIKYFQWKQMI